MSKTAEPKPLVLVDGSSYLYRAFHALPPLTTSAGAPTGALLGVLNMLYKLLDDEAPERFAVVFDASGKTFRDDLYAEYKANRPPMPDDLRAQVEPLLEAIDAMGLPLLRVKGVEADDVIGTLVRQNVGVGGQALVSTGDKDMAQLVQDGVRLVNTMTGQTLDREAVVAKFGVEPGQIIDWLALVGDSSDNIPGVPKVGPKTAAKWLAKYGDLDTLIANADDIGGKVGESLRQHLDQLALSRQLATIRQDVQLDLGEDALALREPDYDRLARIFKDFELSSLYKRLPEGAGGEAAADAESAVEARYDILLDDADFQAWLRRLEAAEAFAFDTETTSLDYMQARIVGVSFATDPGEAAYVPLAHTYPGAPDQLDRDTVLARLKPLLDDPARPKIGHHLKYDAHVLANHGIALRGIAFDTMLESYVLDSTATRHDMESVARK